MLTSLLAIFLTISAVIIMSFIAMAVPIGPWIDVTLVLCGGLMWRVLGGRLSEASQRAIWLAAIAGGLGGALATAVGFSWATCHFLEPHAFAGLLAQPLWWSLLLGGLTLAAGGLGLTLAWWREGEMLDDARLPFPVGMLMHTAGAAQEAIRQSMQLVWGGLTAMACGLLQYACMLPKVLLVCEAFQWGIFCWPALAFPLSWVPLLGAIGFVAGGLVVKPLLAGMFLKQFVVLPIRALFFAHIPESELVFAWCSGMILYGVLLSVMDFARVIVRIRWGVIGGAQGLSIPLVNGRLYRALGVLGVAHMGVWVLSGFSWYVLVYLISATALSAYQLMYIGGATGLAPIARYATFIMMPALWLFGLSAFQVAVLSAYVEMCGMIAVDALFGARCGRLGQIEQRAVRRFQLIGLAVTALIIGPITWFLITKLGVGTALLPAQRCLTRALLVRTLERQVMHYGALACGLVSGFLLKKMRINPTLVLTGILLSFDFSLLLCAGGLLSYVFTPRERYEPFCSGMFATSALWLVLQAVIGAA